MSITLDVQCTMIARFPQTILFCAFHGNYVREVSIFRLLPGAFRLYDVDNDGFITREEMYNIVDAIYEMVVSTRLLAFNF